jgi:GR25 family glycosyltransferase involved in LPS biosynthesis
MPHVIRGVKRMSRGVLRPHTRKPLQAQSLTRRSRITTTTTTVTRTTQTQTQVMNVMNRSRVVNGRFLRIQRKVPRQDNLFVPKNDTRVPLPWFPEIKAGFAISMRPNRWHDLQVRLGPWAEHVQKWDATNGYNINVADWVKRGKTVPRVGLTRGQLGCHDSHVKVWKHIVANKISMTLILEDDATLVHNQATQSAIRKAFDDCASLKIPWHIMYLGRQRNKDISRHSALLSRPQGCCGLFAYIVTLEGAQKLLQYTAAYRVPVDVHVGNLSDQGKLNCVALNPRLVWVTSVTHSDTNGIR